MIIETLSGLLIIVLWVVRWLLNKEAGSKNCSASDISFSNSVWTVASALLVVIFFWSKEFIPFFTQDKTFLFPLFMSMVRGAAVYRMVFEFARLSKKSVSSGVFIATSCFPIGSLAVMLFFGEPLTAIDVIAVIMIGIVGFAFFIKGHGKYLTRDEKLAYLTIATCVTLCMVSNRVTAVNYSWAVHFSISTLTWLLVALGIKFLKNIKTGKLSFSILSNKALILLGMVYMTGEVFFMYSMQNIFYAVVPPIAFMTAATPITMFIGSLLYKEGNWKEQLLFGICVIIPVAMIIL